MLEALEDRYAPAVLTVLNNADSGAGSLRALVNTANNGDTINFAPAIKGDTITLTTGQMTLNKSITIDGQTNNITINGGGSSSIFYNPTASLSEEIDNLTFEQGHAASDNGPDFGRGGAIYDLGALTLTSDTFFDNNADGNGGAVYTSGGTLTVSGGMFTENQTNGSSSEGGALYVDSLAGSPGNATLTSVAFSSNSAVLGGGAVYAVTSATTATQLTVSSCDFTGNHATQGSGGAINTDDQLTVTAGSFTGNAAYFNGGAIDYAFVEFPATTSGSMTLKNITFKNNTAGSEGGAVASIVSAAHSTVAVSVTGCLFAAGNDATAELSAGGGLYVSHATSGTGAASLVVANDTFYQDEADYGGGIALENSASNGTTNTVTLTSLTVYQNEASWGGGLWISPATGVPGLRPQLTNNIIAGNYVENPPTDGPDVSGNALSLGYNLIGETDGGTTVWLSTDIVGTSANPQSPGLVPGGPTDNGGLTFTIKLATGSQAYHHGSPTVAGSVDQRGYKRSVIPDQNHQTIGAYDPDATAPPS